MAPQSPLVRTAARYAVRYGPVALAVAQQARGPATDAARKAWETHRAQRLADDHARTTRQGAVLPVVHEGQRYWVVFSADEPVIVYPSPQVPLSVLMSHADVELRRPPAAEATPLLRRIARMGAHRRQDGHHESAGVPSPQPPAAGDAPEPGVSTPEP